jgi:hypothetical protein
MEADDRAAAIRALAQVFLTMSEREADQLLAQVGIERATPGGWGERSDARRRGDIRLLLRDVSDEAVDNLLVATDTDVPTAPASSPPQPAAQSAPPGRG